MENEVRDVETDYAFRNISHTAELAESAILANSSRVLTTGIRFLDLAMNGIMPNDLIVLSSPTGGGKSTLVTEIAQANVRAGKQIYLFALEAEPYEISMRLIYRFATEEFYKVHSGATYRPQYPDFYCNKYPPVFAQYVKLGQDRLKDLDGLHVAYRRDDFNFDRIERHVEAVSDNADLFIIDHLHYVDHSDENEYRALNEITKKLRSLALDTGVPVILVSHVRKSDGRIKRLLPDIEDIHGSSNISKISTKVIITAPAYDQTDPLFAPTYMRVAKNRVNGSVARYVARVNYNISANRFEPGFELAPLKFGSDKFEPIETESMMPAWSRERVVRAVQEVSGREF